MTKFLNLNELNPKETREVQIGEKTYPIKQTSVEDFIETSLVADNLQQETSYAKQLHATIGLIKRAIPTIDESTLLNLSLDQLKALTEFIRGVDAETLIREAQAEVLPAESKNSVEGNV